MDINEKINLINYATRKAAGVETPCDREAAIGYAQALCHAKIITKEKFRELSDVAKNSHQQNKAFKKKRRKDYV
jgi:hypothetical protein